MRSICFEEGDATFQLCLKDYVESHRWVDASFTYLVREENGLYKLEADRKGKILRKSEVDELMDKCGRLIRDEMEKPEVLECFMHALRFVFEPKNVDSKDIRLTILIDPDKYEWCDEYEMASFKDAYRLAINRRDIEYLNLYLLLATGKTNLKNKEYLKAIRENRFRFGFRWCLVGNIKETHEYGERHEIKHGTKHFSGGTKVYVAPAQWGDGFENVVVIGKPRHGSKLIEVVMPSERIENFRLKKVFKPDVLDRMETSSHHWWDDSDKDKERIASLAESINNYSKKDDENVAI